MRNSSVVRTVLIALIAIYIFFALAVRTEWGALAFSLLSLNPDDVFMRGYVWQLVTYAALHELINPFHLIFNALLFFFIGPDLETRWGDRRFITFILITALGGSLFVCAAWALGLSSQPVIGFSSVCLGLLVAWGITYANRIIYILGVIPLRGKTLIWVTLGIEVLYAISNNNTSSAAHFGGMAAAAILTLGLWRPNRIKAYVDQAKRGFLKK